MIRVASLVSYQIMPARMGGQKGIHLFLSYLTHYFPIICYTTINNESEKNESYTIKKMFSTNKLRYINIFYFFRLRKEFKQEGITHLLLEQPYYGWLAFLLKRSLKLKLIIHSHNIESIRFKSTKKWWWRIMAIYEKWVHQRADFNFFITADDKFYAVINYKLKEEKCAVITYGTERSSAPSAEQKKILKGKICKLFNLPSNTLLLLFNGTLNYRPNRMALDSILQNINPLLLSQISLPYKILICGSKLPDSYQDLTTYVSQNIIYAGFVEDINVYFLGADIFLNPVCEGGGIKTKLVEALAAGCSAVSYIEGAIGVPQDITGTKLSVIKNNDGSDFVHAVLDIIHNADEPTPSSFYAYFYWGNIARKAAQKINAI